MVDAEDSKSSAARRAGSSPAGGTIPSCISADCCPSGAGGYLAFAGILRPAAHPFAGRDATHFDPTAAAGVEPVDNERIVGAIVEVRRNRGIECRSRV